MRDTAKGKLPEPCTLEYALLDTATDIAILLEAVMGSLNRYKVQAMRQVGEGGKEVRGYAFKARADRLSIAGPGIKITI